MPTPKPVTAWAVFDPDGKLLLFTITQEPIGAKNRCSNLRNKEWDALSERGYRVRKIRIEVDG